MTRILVAGMGNVLRHDDGVGVAVARQLMAATDLPSNVNVIEVGIGGIHLVQELMDGYDALVIIDAIDRGSLPGSVHVLAAEVDDLSSWSDIARNDFLADMHYTTPSKALILARALGVLPAQSFIAGCQPGETEAMGIGLTAAVERAVGPMTMEIRRLIDRLLVASETTGHPRDQALVGAGG